MILVNLNKNSSIPLYQQVFASIKEMIENNTLTPGTKLPSSREFARKHGISRTVVYNAYEELWGQGYVDSTPGSYTVVREKSPNVKLSQRKEKSIINWENAFSLSIHRVYETYFNSIFPDFSYRAVKPDRIDMHSLSLDRRILPVEDFRKCMNYSINKDSGIFNYGKVEGDLPLRSYIASRLQMHGVYVTSEEVLITNGTQNSIDIVLKLLGRPGSIIITESPTYFQALPLMRFYRTEIVGVPMNNTGIDLNKLETILKYGQTSFVYTMPNFHNPTGITMYPEIRENLIKLCEKYKVPIVEDAFEEEMKYFGKVPLAIKSMDKNQIVIYMSSFSKVLFPGVRVGWIAADKELIKTAVAVKAFSDISTNSVIQAGLYEFCRQGYYDKHIKQMHRVYKKRMETALKALKDELSFDKISWNEPLGGYLIWLELRDLNIPESFLHSVLIKHKIQATPGSLFFNEKQKNHYIRLSISQLNEEEIVEGIKRLKSAMEELYLSRK